MPRYLDLRGFGFGGYVGGWKIMGAKIF